MAHIVIRPNKQKPPAIEFTVNGMDLSNDMYRGSIEFVEVGEESEFRELGLRVTLALDSLDLGEGASS